MNKGGQNQGSSNYHASRWSPRRAKVGDALAADSLASLQPGKTAVFARSCRNRKHRWLMGTENAVCARCLVTIPKDWVDRVDAGQVEAREVYRLALIGELEKERRP